MKTNASLQLRSDGKLRGETKIPGDKSISHRAVMLASIAKGASHIRNWLAAGDTEATLGAMQSLGVRIQRHDPHTLAIHGGRLRKAKTPLNLANAGTGIRLLTGLMVGQPFATVLDGSAQLRRRPMKRITAPLRMMGADIRATNGGSPMYVRPAQLAGITYQMPIASGQVKSAILLAGLYADSPTTIIEPGPARDHTERILRSMGVPITSQDNRLTMSPSAALSPLDITVPGDFSSAAFLLTAALLIPESSLIIRAVNLNPTRTGLLDALLEMGADITVEPTGAQAGEPIGDLHVKTSQLKGIDIGGETVVRMIDEFPVLMVAALRADGETVVRDAQELRVKETDRIAVMAQELGKMGAQIEERQDGFRIIGPQSLRGAQVDGHDDHRIAMSLTVAGLLASHETLLTDAACAADSFPQFAETLQAIGANVRTANGC